MWPILITWGLFGQAVASNLENISDFLANFLGREFLTEFLAELCVAAVGNLGTGELTSSCTVHVCKRGVFGLDLGTTRKSKRKRL